MYYYRGMIYLDYTMMAAMDVELMSELKTMDEQTIRDASVGSLKKCMELDSRGEWKDQISAKVNMLRSTMINGGVEMFQQENQLLLGQNRHHRGEYPHWYLTLQRRRLKSPKH